MNTFPNLTSHLSEMLGGLVDEQLDDQQFDELQQLLATDGAALEAYLAYVDLHVCLPRSLSGVDVATVVVTDSTGSAVGKSPGARSSILGFLAGVRRSVPGGEFTVGTLILLVLVAAFWGLNQGLFNPAGVGHDVAEGLDADGASVEHAVATIRAAKDVQWSSERPKSGGAIVKSAESLGIKSGIVELQLKQGATLIVEGPAEWSIDGDNKASLKLGRLLARVPAQAVGFTLETPGARIVDLSTEFGVEVAKAGTVDVHVQKGCVEIQSDAEAKTGKRVRLITGESAQVNRDRTQVVNDPAFGDKFDRLAQMRTSTVLEKRPLANRKVDLTRDAVATQSSEYVGREGPAQLAIDDNLASFTHTGLKDRLTWWQVDLGKPRVIAFVVLRNRAEMCKGRLRDITIKLIDADGKTETPDSAVLNPGNRAWGGAKDINQGPSELVFDLTDGPAMAQFVRVERTPCDEGMEADHSVLSLGEVEVFETENARPAASSNIKQVQ